MPHFYVPRNDNKRLTLLNRALITATQDIEKGNMYVSDEIITKLKDFIPEFKENLNALSSKLSKRSKEIRGQEESIELLKVHIRDIWESIKRRKARNKEPAEVLLYYQLPLSGKVPRFNRRNDWITIATLIIRGDTKAIEAGYEPVVNPTAAELSDILTKAQTESNQVALADREYDIAQEKLEKLRPIADELIYEIMAELRFRLRKEDASSQQRIMKTYGADFK